METGGSSSGALSAVERARNLSQALSNAARLARVSSRHRMAYSGGGFQARRGARLLRLAFLSSLFLIVVLPTAVSVAYFGFFASDQYVAEAKFSLTTGEVPQLDTLGALTGLAAVSIVQDTQIVVNYISSRSAVEALQDRVALRELYEAPTIDYFSRFGQGKPIEKFLRYWSGKVDASISMPAGIIILRVTAFSPQDAQRIAAGIIDISEALVNDMNDRMNKDAIDTATIELQRASDRLAKARLSLERARTSVGVLDPGKTGEAMTSLITQTRTALLQMQRDYATNIKFVSATAPQMTVLKDRIDTLSKQVSDLEATLTAGSTAKGDPAGLAGAMRVFSELDLEREIAERLYSGSAAALEVARMAGEQKRVYINPFVRPALPEEPQFTRRFVPPLIIGSSLLLAWGLIWGLLSVVRNHMG